MEMAVEHINQHFTLLLKILSPNAAKSQLHLDVFDERNKKDRKLSDNGLMNYNLCLNAETEQAHTECDSSYTVICVPNHIQSKTRNGNQILGVSNFILTQDQF